MKEALDNCYTENRIAYFTKTDKLLGAKALASSKKVADSKSGICFVEYGNWETGVAQVNHEKCEIRDLKRSGDTTLIIIIVVCVLLAICIGLCAWTKCKEKK